jgi:hypothetical protein
VRAIQTLSQTVSKFGIFEALRQKFGRARYLELFKLNASFSKSGGEKMGGTDSRNRRSESGIVGFSLGS